MDRSDVDWRGFLAATPTPFHRGGELATEFLEKAIEYFYENGAHGLVVNGGTGEYYAQSSDERSKVAEVAAARWPHDRPLLVGITSNRIEQTVDLAKHAERLQVDGVLLAPPLGAYLTASETVAFYTDVCRQTGLPVMAYNIPFEVGTDILPETIVRIAEIANIVAVKDSTSSQPQLHRTVELAADRIRVFGGNLLNPVGISMMISGFGGDGQVGTGMPMGRRQPQAFEAVWAGRNSEALAIAREYSALRERLAAMAGPRSYAGYNSQIKAIMNLTGVPVGFPRRPKLPVEDDPAALAELGSVIAEFNLDSAKQPRTARHTVAS